MNTKYDETLLDPAAPVLQAADFTFGNCEWPYAEEMGDTHPVEAHLTDDVEGEDLFIPGDPEAVRLKGRKGFKVLSFANNHWMHAGYRAFLRTMQVMLDSGLSGSDERRVGIECCSTCWSRWLPDNTKKTKNHNYK